MNVQSPINEVNAGPMSLPGPGAKAWFNHKMSQAGNDIKNLNVPQKLIISGCIAATILFVATVYMLWGTSSSVEQQALPETVVVAPLNPDATSLSQQAISILRAALEQSRLERAEDRGMINTHTGEIKSVKQDLSTLKTKAETDPKVLKGLQDDLAAIKKIMAVPPVKLVPMSARESTDKTS